MPTTDADDEFTIDELASRAGMTVRNVRAYAGRGLLPAPRLSGRTGYYGLVHLNRLQLVRELVDRGYTLAAVERAIANQPVGAAGHTLDLLQVLGAPLDAEEVAEIMSRDALAALAGVERDSRLVDQLVALGLAEELPGDRLSLTRPSVVRAGAAAIALGLSATTVLELLPTLSTHLGAVARDFVDRVRDELWQPFVERGMPEDEWSKILRTIEALLPVAGQATIAVFRTELARAIGDAMGEELAALAGEGAEREA